MPDLRAAIIALAVMVAWVGFTLGLVVGAVFL